VTLSLLPRRIAKSLSSSEISWGLFPASSACLRKGSLLGFEKNRVEEGTVCGYRHLDY
jgi:hypothetical protein